MRYNIVLLMKNKIIKRTIDIAKAICPLNLDHRCSHIAFLVKKNKIVHIGTNSCKSNPHTLKYEYEDHQRDGVHAELSVCLKSGKQNLSNYKMIVLRVDRNGNLTNSKPCSGCQSVIKQFNINNVWHSDSEGKVVKN